MNSFTPIFDSIVDSSLWEEPLHVRVLFVTMLALKSRDHVVRANEYRLTKRANLTIEQVQDALNRLQSADIKRPGQLYEGRRIEAVEDGWVILNGEYYQKQMTLIADRNRKAKWARENRARESGKPVKGEEKHERLVRNGASLSELDQHTTNNLPAQCQ